MELLTPENIESFLEQPEKLPELMFSSLHLSAALIVKVYQGMAISYEMLREELVSKSDSLSFSENDCIVLAKVAFATAQRAINKESQTSEYEELLQDLDVETVRMH